MSDPIRWRHLDAILMLAAALSMAACSSDTGAEAGDVTGAQRELLAPGGILGVFAGNETADVEQFEQWLGRPVDAFLGNTGMANWEDYDGSIGWAVSQWEPLDRRVLWSVPLIPWGATLAEAATGAYDEHYVQAAQTLASYRPGDGELYVRTGWEFNIEQFPWQVSGHPPEEFIGAFQHFVTSFRSVSSRFKFDWNANWGGDKDLAAYYPGDDYVDIIGMDFYWFLEWDPADPEQAWSSKVNGPNGLQWHQDFAAAHGKPTAYAEWGIQSDDAGPYIQHAADWFQSHDVVYQTYWNSDEAYPGKLSDDRFPNAGAAYRAAFGR